MAEGKGGIKRGNCDKGKNNKRDRRLGKKYSPVFNTITRATPVSVLLDQTLPGKEHP